MVRTLKLGCDKMNKVGHPVAKNICARKLEYLSEIKILLRSTRATIHVFHTITLGRHYMCFVYLSSAFASSDMSIIARTSINCSITSIFLESC